MVALHVVQHEVRSLDPAIGDEDLVLALEPGVGLDDATLALLKAAADTLEADAWFTDVEIDGRTIRRPAWSPTRLLADPTASSPLAVRAGWLRSHDATAGDPVLALSLAAANATVAHLPAVLTRHSGPLSAPSASDLDHHLASIGIPATAAQTGDRFRLTPDPDFAPTVSVVIPTAGANVDIDGDPHVAVQRLLSSLGSIPDRIELIAVVGDEYRGDPTDVEGFATLVRRPPGPFNFAHAINIGVLRATHDTVLMLNDDTEADGTTFIDRMALHLADPTVAAVGAELRYPDGSIQHAGLVIDDARPLHPFVGWDPVDTGPHGGDVARDVVAVTGGCLMTRRRDFLAVGGLSPGFPLSFNDVDLCVRLRRSVGRVVVEPAASLLHHETLTRKPETTATEWDRWIARWGEIADPWYHPGHHRPDDPHRLHHNADHLEPAFGAAQAPGEPRTGRLLSRVHRGRPAPSPQRSIVTP